jgi:hypothetical protein
VQKLSLNVSWKQKHISNKQNILTEFSIKVFKMKEETPIEEELEIKQWKFFRVLWWVFG